ncbi:FliO/MopB family protein [Stakelama marina]|uniref:FliO/MopB family protein n=1 Tax=Stakelama marina TaxID=2826939 RepID=A0A8T4I9Z3_9SPHN|nr:flagellar biosynthetic protein FliO [Stakelama marina]MBR0550952.1 FliO/MopB family protein [Stakelama marina]
MEALAIIRTLGALTIVLGLLAGALWVVRRYDLRLPGRVGGHSGRRLELVERLGIDQRRSAVLLRRDGREHLIILSPEGHLMVETVDHASTEPAEAMPETEFAEMVETDMAEATAEPRSFADFVDAVLDRSGVSLPSWFNRLLKRNA